MLVAVASIRESDNRAMAANGGDGAGSMVRAAIEAAGCLFAPAGPELERRADWEVFYSCPSATASAFFEQISALAEQLAAQADRAAQQRLDSLLEAAATVQVRHTLTCSGALFRRTPDPRVAGASTPRPALQAHRARRPAG
jgi:hypothetical protein